jgi:hypothetical protein
MSKLDIKSNDNLLLDIENDCDTFFKNILTDSSFIGEVNPNYEEIIEKTIKNFKFSKKNSIIYISKSIEGKIKFYCHNKPDLLLGLYNIPLNSKIYISDFMCKFSCIELKNNENFIEFNNPINLLGAPYTQITVHDPQDNIVKNFNYRAMTTYSLETLNKLQSWDKKLTFQIVNNGDNLVIWRGFLDKEIA